MRAILTRTATRAPLLLAVTAVAALVAGCGDNGGY